MKETRYRGRNIFARQRELYLQMQILKKYPWLATVASVKRIYVGVPYLQMGWMDWEKRHANQLEKANIVIIFKFNHKIAIDNKTIWNNHIGSHIGDVVWVWLFRSSGIKHYYSCKRYTIRKGNKKVPWCVLNKHDDDDLDNVNVNDDDDDSDDDDNDDGLEGQSCQRRVPTQLTIGLTLLEGCLTLRIKMIMMRVHY